MNPITILQGISAGSSLLGALNMGRKSFQGVDMDVLKEHLSGMYDTAEGFLDPNSEQNTNLLQLIMGNAKNQAMASNMANQRNIAMGGGLSGIANANSRANMNSAMNQGNANFLGALQQNRALGGKMMSDYSQNLAQGYISNQAMRNQANQAGAAGLGNIGLGILKYMTGGD